MLGDFIRQLYKQHGPQGWWPRLTKSAEGRVQREEFPKENFPFSLAPNKVSGRFPLPYIVQHHAADRSNWLLQGADLEIWEVVLGAILTQNTNWNNVEKALINLADNDLLHPEKIRDAVPELLEQSIRPAGYFRQKAKKLKGVAEFYTHSSRHPQLRQGNREEMPSTKHQAPSTREIWLSQWGIGPETADTILLYGYNLPIFVVDAYTRRLLTHLTKDPAWLKKPYDEVRTYCEEEVPGGVEEWQEAHALIVRWGKQKIRRQAPRKIR